MKPVIHTTASIGTGMICVLKPETIGMTLGDMLQSVFIHLFPTEQPVMRSLLTFFIDQGYLEISKMQSRAVTNLIQIMEEMNAKFLGMVNNKLIFPYQFVEVNPDGKHVVTERFLHRCKVCKQILLHTPNQCKLLFYGMEWERVEARESQLMP